MDSLYCDDDADCATGYFCSIPSTTDPAADAPRAQGTCVKKEDPVVGCHSDEECPVGQHCSVSDGDCGTDPNCPMCDVCYGHCVDDLVAIQCGPEVPCPAGMVCEEQIECPPCVYADPPCKVACLQKYVCAPQEPVACKSDADCLEGMYCVFPPLTYPMNCCMPGQICLMIYLPCEGTCQPKPAACTSSEECPKGQACHVQTVCPDCYYQDPPCLMPCWTEGACQAPCESDDQCAAEEFCNILRCGDTRCAGPYFCEPRATM
jgi:hypothetical protein